MELFTKMIQLQIQLLLLMLLGMLAHKKGFIDGKSRKSLSALLINIVLPCNIVNSFLGKIEVTADLFQTCVLAIVISAAIQLTASISGKFIFRQFPEEKSKVMTYGLIVSNSSFIGIPVVETIYGSLAVMLTSVFQIPIRITMWTAGLTLFTNVKKEEAFKKVAMHPCVIVVAVGFLLMLLKVPMPAFVTGTIGTVSKCTTTMSMLIIGSVLAEINWKSIINYPVLYYSFIRLIGFPLVVFLVLKVLNVPSLLISLSVILTGMPAGSTTAILAEQYGCDSKYAAQIILVSTVLSVLTIPVLCLFL